jgi:hypothetical protein
VSLSMKMQGNSTLYGTDIILGSKVYRLIYSKVIFSMIFREYIHIIIFRFHNSNEDFFKKIIIIIEMRDNDGNKIG